MPTDAASGPNYNETITNDLKTNKNCNSRPLLKSTVEIILLAVHLPTHIIKGFPPQRPPTTDADKAGRVVKVSHGLTRLTAEASYFLGATVADSWR